MTNAEWNVRDLSPDEWRLLRKIRLGALLESPDAFLSTYEREAAWDEHKWRQTFEAANWLVVVEDERLIGLLRSFRDPERPWLWQVESTWVAPTYRRLGIFRALLRALVDRLRWSGVSDLLLWVLEDNYAARQVYKRLGFELTGERQPLPGDRYELRLRRGVSMPLAI